MTLDIFRQSLGAEATLISRLRDGLIGEGVMIDGPYGPKPLLYADYTASGRALVQVEDYVRAHVLPYYANSHTQASFCGAYMNRLRAAARRAIADAINAGPDDTIIFTGAGATAAVNHLVALTGLDRWSGEGPRPVVFVGPYEHHSNILPWRETAAEVIEIPEAVSGGPDLAALSQALLAHADRSLLIGAFSAASNVTGVLTQVDCVTRMLKRHGALAFWDYAAGAPYLPIDMNKTPDGAMDALYFSPHKFLGGPGASGVLAVKTGIAAHARPTWPGGGTVSFVSPWTHRYSTSLAAREEAGTPNMIGDIRAALVLLIKASIGQDTIDRREGVFNEMALARWRANPHIELLGTGCANRLPIFAMRIKDGQGGYVHHQLVTRMLSDMYGVQARGGCACAGPYAHRLLGLDRDASEDMLAALERGEELKKPGWMRLNFSYVMSEEGVQRIIDAVDELASKAAALAGDYCCNPATAQFSVNPPSSSADPLLAANM